MSEELRDRFEAWALSRGMRVVRYAVGDHLGVGDYQDDYTLDAWAAWQAAIAYIRQHDDWLPIETAPKNGSIILLFGRNQRGGNYIADAKWTGGAWCLFDPKNDAHEWPSDYHTHWRSLPAPPKEQPK